jgi:hypothetical protein
MKVCTDIKPLDISPLFYGSAAAAEAAKKRIGGKQVGDTGR